MDSKEVLEQAGVNRSLLANVKSRKLRYFGHIMIGANKSLENDNIIRKREDHEERG